MMFKYTLFLFQFYMTRNDVCLVIIIGIDIVAYFYAIPVGIYFRCYDFFYAIWLDLRVIERASHSN